MDEELAIEYRPQLTARVQTKRAFIFTKPFPFVPIQRE